MSNGSATENHLLVPISMEALVVERNLGRWSDLSVDFSRLYQGDIFGSQLTPALFNAGDCPHGTGVHLHWTLPAALRRGGNRLVRARSMAKAHSLLAERLAEARNETEKTRLAKRLLALGSRLTALVGGAQLGTEQADAVAQLSATPDENERKQVAKKVVLLGRQLADLAEQEPQGELQFPVIPNRWLVQRIWREPGASEISLRAWVVESDYRYGTDGETSIKGAITVPLFDALPLFDYIGKSFDYPGWQEGKEQASRVELTALGYGDPAFTAYYSSCKSVLGFHDALEDMKPDTAITYLVVGWYSDPAKDILQRFDLEELNWACLPPPTAESYPTRTLCHGAMYDIQWKRMAGNGEKYRAKIPFLAGEHCTVAIGNTSTEALAALVAQKLNKPKLETLLTAFTDDALSTETGYVEMESRLHQYRFASSTGGTQFCIQKKQAEQGQPLTATDAALSEALENALTRLNVLQRDCDRQERELESARWELYATWSKWAGKYMSQDPREEPTDITAILEREKSNLQEKEQTLAEKKAELNQQYNTIDSILTQQFPDLEFGKTLTPSLWRPNDPVVLVAAPGLSASSEQRRGQRNGAQEQLICRVSGREATTLAVNIPNGQTGVRVSADQVLQIQDPGLFGDTSAVPKGIGALLRETLMLDPAHAEAIAEQAYSNAALQTRRGKDTLVAQIQQWQRTPSSATGKTTGLPVSCENGFPPALLALRDWDGNPWLPLFLEWEVSWRSSYNSTSLDNVLKNWEFVREDGEFRWAGGAPTDSASIYQGYSIVSSNVTWTLQERLEKYNKDKHLKELDQVITQLGEMNILAQTLRGLHDAFLMRDQILRPQPINPRIFSGYQEESARDPIATFLTGLHNLASPDPDKTFFPVRAGHMKLLRVEIIDAFGQTVEVPLLQLIRAASLTPHGTGMEEFVQLSPRLSQPVRLRLDWVPAENPPETLPVNSPVCGWIIPNHLDTNLLFYDASGAPLGVLQKILRVTTGGTGGAADQDAKAFFWVPMPGTEHRPETIYNPELSSFVQFLERMGADTGAAFWNLLDDALARTDPGEPEDDPLLSVLLGRPLALVKASVQLELDGLPATDQSLKNLGKSESHGLTKVKFPAGLGDAANARDGVIGFFVHGAESKISAPLYAPAGATVLPGLPVPGVIEYKDSHDFLDCETPVVLTLLMDPRAMVHLTTGILPKSIVELPSRVSSAAKSAKEAFFQVAPLISPGGDVSMPTPSDDFGKWSWAYRPQVTMWKEADTIIAASDRAGFHPRPQQISEGWLKLKMNPVAILSFWVKEGLLEVPMNTNVTLAWVLQGGDRLVLLANDNENEPVKIWPAPPLPEQYGVQVKADTTYFLILFNKDNSRAERRLTIRLAEGNSHG